MSFSWEDVKLWVLVLVLVATTAPYSLKTCGPYGCQTSLFSKARKPFPMLEILGLGNQAPDESLATMMKCMEAYR
jgi:hypothetical protein